MAADTTAAACSAHASRAATGSTETGTEPECEPEAAPEESVGGLRGRCGGSRGTRECSGGVWKMGGALEDSRDLRCHMVVGGGVGAGSGVGSVAWSRGLVRGIVVLSRHIWG